MQRGEYEVKTSENWSVRGVTHKGLERVRDNVAEFDPLDETRGNRGLAVGLAKRELRVIILPELVVDLKG